MKIDKWRPLTLDKSCNSVIKCLLWHLWYYCWSQHASYLNHVVLVSFWQYSLCGARLRRNKSKVRVNQSAGSKLVKLDEIIFVNISLANSFTSFIKSVSLSSIPWLRHNWALSSLFNIFFLVLKYILVLSGKRFISPMESANWLEFTYFQTCNVKYCFNPRIDARCDNSTGCKS